MAEAAAFFANKKKKKKAFKFNANKIDASTVTQTIHVYVSFQISVNISHQSDPFSFFIAFFCWIYSDAPALSTDNDAADLPDAAETTVATTNESSEQWDDEKLASKTTRKTAVANASSTELLDMKALDLKGNDQDDIAEKLRIEETKAKLAAAKEGMEREAQKLKEEQEKKEQEGKHFKKRGRKEAEKRQKRGRKEAQKRG